MEKFSFLAESLASDLSRQITNSLLLDQHDRPKEAKVYRDLAIESLIELGNQLGFDVIGKGKPE